MGVSQRVQILSDESERLQVLREFIKNPNLFDDLSQEVQRLNALTEEENSKYTEAKNFLSEYEEKKKEIDSLSDDYKKLKTSVDAERLALEQQKNEFSSYVQAKNLEISQLENAAIQKNSENDNLQKSLVDLERSLEREKSEFEKSISAIKEQLDDQREKQSQIQGELDQYKSALDKRAKKITLLEQASEL